MHLMNKIILYTDCFGLVMQFGEGTARFMRVLLVLFPIYLKGVLPNRQDTAGIVPPK